MISGVGVFGSFAIVLRAWPGWLFLRQFIAIALAEGTMLDQALWAAQQFLQTASILIYLYHEALVQELLLVEILWQIS